MTGKQAVIIVIVVVVALLIGKISSDAFGVLEKSIDKDIAINAEIGTCKVVPLDGSDDIVQLVCTIELK